MSRKVRQVERRWIEAHLDRITTIFRLQRHMRQAVARRRNAGSDALKSRCTFPIPSRNAAKLDDLNACSNGVSIT